MVRSKGTVHLPPTFTHLTHSYEHVRICNNVTGSTVDMVDLLCADGTSRKIVQTVTYDTDSYQHTATLLTTNMRSCVPGNNILRTASAARCR